MSTLSITPSPLPPAPPAPTAPTSAQALKLPSLDSITMGLDHYAGVRLGVSGFGTFTRGGNLPKMGRGGATVSSRAASSAFSLGNMAKAGGAAALFAVPLAIATNFLDWRAGKVTERQRNVLMGADAAGYTAAGAGGSVLGAAIGASFLGPALGGAVGLVASLGLGYVYEKYIRPRFMTLGEPADPVTTPPPPPPDDNWWEPK